jgi:hypothetical protein
MEYVRTAAPVAVQLFGPEDAGYLLHLTGRLIGMQHYDEVALAFGASRGGPDAFAGFLRALLVAQGDDVAAEGDMLHQPSWRLMKGVADAHPACARLLDGLFEGLAMGCGRGIKVTRTGDTAPFAWRIE